MNIQINTDENKITLLDNEIEISELIKELRKLFPNGEWKKYKLCLNKPINLQYVPQPIVVPYYPQPTISPYYPQPTIDPYYELYPYIVSTTDSKNFS